MSEDLGSMQGSDWNHRYSSLSRETLTRSDMNEKKSKASSILSKVGVMISTWLSEKSVVIYGFVSLFPKIDG